MLSKVDADAAHAATWACLTSYSFVSRKSIEAMVHRYHLTFKWHWWAHLASDVRRYNVKLGQVFIDEDFVGRIAKIAHSASYARGDLRSMEPLFDKYLLGMELNLSMKDRFGP